MANFRDSVIKNIINPTTQSKLTNAMGRVLRYNSAHNVADVYIEMLNSGTGKTLTDVPVQLAGTGIHPSNLKENDMVYIQFNNSSIYQPKITGKADEYYALNTKKSESHLTSGELSVSQEELEGDVSPSSDTWLDSENTNLFKYNGYKNSSAIENIAQIREVVGKFKDQEVGIYNPISSSVVKVKDDGTIDIFAEANIGIRINPNSKTIEFLGNSTTKADKWTVISNTVEIKANELLSITAKEINLTADTITRNGEKI